jgi:hypothetical protein
MVSEDDEILEAFLEESKENLDQLDLDLVELEERPTDPELLARVFRTIHTIKGTCGFLGFRHLEELSHAARACWVPFAPATFVWTRPSPPHCSASSTRCVGCSSGSRRTAARARTATRSSSRTSLATSPEDRRRRRRRPPRWYRRSWRPSPPP